MDSMKKLKRRNKTPKIKRADTAAMVVETEKSHGSAIDKKIRKKKKTSGDVLEKVSSKTFEPSSGGEKSHDRMVDKKVKKKKKTTADVLHNVSSKTSELSDTGDEAREAIVQNKKSEELINKKRKKSKLLADGEQGKSKTMKKKKRSSADVQTIDDYGEEPNILAEQDDEDVGSLIKPESEELERADTRRSKTGKSKKAGKMKKKRKSLANDTTQDKLPGRQESAPETEVHAMPLDKQDEAPEIEVYEMSSGDEDYSNGMRKWIVQYHQSRPGIKVLQERIDDFIMAHEAREEQKRKEHAIEIEKDGFQLVVHHKGRKKTTDAESGTAVGSVSAAAVLDKMAKKKNNNVGLDFYRFQKRDAQRSELMMLQSKFEQDKKRIQQLRAERKFRPY